ncbi:GNAT family N-acetyltransferase [Fluoribacter gormanii]|uniref:Ribosomal-protein-S5-alanine N-acetyltransferase n=1 Tax=Fluoribacter gormanii TaxID=464 RepID=A0A377GH05_9GAMM|nr:GNAT family protein [Fluoribacter gormanii]KTD02254.1 GNAT family acetyltransferase [Fluoribacter gormanii]MCW8444442.1 GNAT family N-acetyltransferase [Fluoribacter gormanii]MCW8469635.1 GNAT family N-acetyltransferase [Fluoribacter gormanii]SIR26587.1 ribosomal-protein-alanine N-acetyltransferase [Fluoribacter gormanii]STO24038.1 ribosomal-protein-S5-alanine N-acetyltransferase [Fluoribacter gormanii]
MHTKNRIYLRQLNQHDEANFLLTMQKSRDFHHPFVTTPQTHEEFQAYIQKFQQEEQRCFLALNQNDHIIGVFNINEIIRGVFQSAYMGYFASVTYAGQGLMSHALKLVLKEIFLGLKLHRIEANIQPTNTASIHLVTKNGFLKEGFSPRYLKINGIWCDHFRFALTYEDWLTNQ